MMKMKQIIGLLLCALAACFAVACQPDSSDNEDQKAGSWAQYEISTDSCAGFKEGFNRFKYASKLSLVLPDFADESSKCSYHYQCILTAGGDKEWNDFKVDYPQFAFEEFEDEDIVKIYGESYFIFGTTDYVLGTVDIQADEQEEGVKTYKVVCGDLTLLTVNVQLSENADGGLYDTVLQRIVNSLTVL